MNTTMPKWKQRTILGLSLVLGLLFLFGGVTKIIGTQMHVDDFTRWQLPQWFRVVTGLFETSAALLLIVSARTRFYGAALLAATMTGALITHLRVHEYGVLPAPMVFLALAALVAWIMRPEFVRSRLTLHRHQPHAV